MNDELRVEYFNPPELRITAESLYIELDSRWRHSDSWQPYSCLYLVAEGEGVLTRNGEEIVMRPGNAYLMPAGTKFSYRCDERLVKLYFHFNILGQDGLDQLRNLQEIHSVPMRPGELDEMLQYYRGEDLAQSMALRHTLYDVVSRLLATYPAELMRSKAHSPLVTRVMEYIQTHLSYNLSCGEIANALFVAEVTLRQKFKKETGSTLRKYIEDLVLFQGELMLKTTRMSIGQISSKLGFCDQFYFSRRFTAHYKLSPREYRRQENG